MFNSFITAMAWAEKASFNSINPISSIDRLALDNAFLVDSTGPIPMISGETPEDA